MRTILRDAAQEEEVAKAARLARQILIAGGDGPLAEGKNPGLMKDVDWQVFLELAHEERVGPLLYHRVKKRQIVPLFVERELENSYLFNARRNMVLLRALRLAVERLRRAEIKVIVLKGAALAEISYKNIALRMMRDLDILVQREFAEAALLALKEMGYEAETETRSGASIAYENEVMLHKTSSEPYTLEVHWTLFDSPFYQDVPLDWYWETADETTTTQGIMHVLSPEAQILYYCGHLQLHHAHESQLLWLFDLKQVIEASAGRLDWPLIVEKAQEDYLVLSLRKTLSELAADWNVSVPSNVIAKLQTAEVSKKEAEVFSLLTARERPVAQRFLADLRMMPTWRRRLHYGWINLFPAPAYMYDRYGFTSAVQLPFYYVYRFYLGARSVMGR